jgi:16S rRNA C967 or C1407 C5-methylase (RsmB/RsmF family)/NOL1/NOP2/fmu family ribosome biogenesis protein
MELLPGAFVDQMKNQLNESFPDFAEALQKPSPVSIRKNPRKAAMVNADRVPWASYGLYLSQRPSFTLDPLFHGGAYYVQEASSMFLEHALKETVDLTQPLKVLDLCAAPGGKSTHLLSLINSESLLVSNEVIRSRAAVLSENIQKWGYPNVLITNNDPEDFSPLQGYFDVIVVDAPCSGEGLFRKDPNAMKEWSPENVSLCSARQKRILSDVWPALKTGGVLIYCTCTYNELENENNLEWFARENKVEFPKVNTDASWGIERVEKNNVTGFHFYPNKARGEGFFLSVMRKSDPINTIKIKRKVKINSPSKKTEDVLQRWITKTAVEFRQHQELVFFVPEDFSEQVDFLLQYLKFVYTGTNLASLKHDKLVPEHSLALSTYINDQNFLQIDVDEETAINYLRKETINFPEAPKGYTLLKYSGVPIGWINVIQNRVNNMYPSEWRIRMSR